MRFDLRARQRFTGACRPIRPGLFGALVEAVLRRHRPRLADDLFGVIAFAVMLGAYIQHHLGNKPVAERLFSAFPQPVLFSEIFVAAVFRPRDFLLGGNFAAGVSSRL